MKYALTLLLSVALCGCLSVKLGDDKPKQTAETVLVANPLNVYRSVDAMTIRVKCQEPDGTWKECKEKVIIPQDWYIVSGVGLESSDK